MKTDFSVNNAIEKIALFCEFISNLTGRHGLDSYSGLLLLILRENPENAEFYFKYSSEPLNELLEKQLIINTENGYSLTSKGAILAKSISDYKFKYDNI